MIVVQLIDWLATLAYLATGELTFRQVSTASFLPLVFITALLWWHPYRRRLACVTPTGSSTGSD